MAHSLHATYLQDALCFTIIKMPWLIEYCKSWGEDFKKIRDHLVMGSHQLQHQCVRRPASSFCLYRILTIHTPPKVLKATFVVLTLQFMSPGAHDVMKTERKTGTLWRLKSLLVMQLVNKNYTSSEEAPFLFAHLSLNM